MLTTAMWMLLMRSTCPQTKYLFDTEGTPILSEEVERPEMQSLPIALRVAFWHIPKLCQSFLKGLVLETGTKEIAMVEM